MAPVLLIRRVLEESRTMAERIEFSFQDLVVGYIEGIPRAGERCGYMPYRGIGHLRLVEAIRSSGAQECSCVVKGERHGFVVCGMPEVGVMEIEAVVWE